MALHDNTGYHSLAWSTFARESNIAPWESFGSQKHSHTLIDSVMRALAGTMPLTFTHNSVAFRVLDTIVCFLCVYLVSVST